MQRIRLLYGLVKNRLQSIISGKDEADAIKIFIKREPHKKAKIDEGRLRLISSVSLIDAMVDRILFVSLQGNQIENVGKTPVMMGWSPLKGGYRLLANQCKADKYLMIDKSNWDWTVQPWLIDVLRALIDNLSIDAPDWWRTAVDQRFKMLFESPTFKFSDGSYGIQPGKGIMKSGCYLTILLNSFSQMILHYVIENRLKETNIGDPYCLGDDTIQTVDETSRIDDYVREMESLGFQPKVKVDGEREFAGFKIYNDKFLPEYLDKHLFVLSHLTLEREIAISTLESYQLLYGFDEGMLRKIWKICRDRSYFEAIWSRHRILMMASS